jgi:hypothetical protein
VGSSVYETAVKYGTVMSFDSALYIKVLDTKKLIYGMKNILKNRLSRELCDSDLERICELLNVLNEEQRAGVLAGKSMYKDVVKASETKLSEADLKMMEQCFPKHSPYVLEPDMN